MEEKIKQLCCQYGFRYDTINIYIKIISKRDTWFIINREYKSIEDIKLYHGNNYGGAGIHRQKGKYKNIFQIFEYINRHDNKEFKQNNNIWRISKILNQL
jgi:U3 small nucleolar RNA-associated protein 14